MLSKKVFIFYFNLCYFNQKYTFLKLMAKAIEIFKYDSNQKIAHEPEKTAGFLENFDDEIYKWTDCIYEPKGGDVFLFWSKDAFQDDYKNDGFLRDNQGSKKSIRGVIFKSFYDVKTYDSNSS